MIVAVIARVTLVAVIVAALVTLIVVAAGVAIFAGVDSAARRRLAARDDALLARSR